MDGDPCEKSKIGNCETDSPEANGDDEEVEGQFWDPHPPVTGQSLGSVLQSGRYFHKGVVLIGGERSSAAAVPTEATKIEAASCTL